MEAEFEVLNPRGDIDPIVRIGLNPRLTDLNQATVGLYATFKEHWVLILDEIGKQLKELYPGITFARYQYTKDLNSYTQVAELAKDPDERPGFEEWIKGVDGVIVANADAGSCTLYLTYNAALPEHLGKPTVLTVASDFVDLLKRSADLRGVPALRYARLEILDIAMEPDMKPWVERIIPERVREALPAIIRGLTEPLTPEEAAVPVAPKNGARVAMKGTLDEVYATFYRDGWTYGMPIMPPTQEAVDRMLTGTNMPADHVVAVLPPQMGKATIERIAINGVMAGCLPTHMPVLVAAVEALADPHMWLEAYTCSIASWAPLLMVNGPVRKDLNLPMGSTLLSPYRRGNAAIAHAVGLMIMNIAGIKAEREDMAMFGHEGRFGMCVAEYEEESPWEPMHVYYGLQEDDSAITLSWPNTRYFAMLPEDIGVVLKGICEGIPAFGFDPGCTVIMSPQLAKFLHAHGLSRKDVVDYIVEYARIPASGLAMRWMIGHHHEPKTVPLPLDPTRMARKFWSGMHLPIMVAGGNGIALVFYGGGGDHGGPITKKIHLPENWRELVERYKE
jgi:hypothetical protein